MIRRFLRLLIRRKGVYPIPNGNPTPRSRYLTYEQMNLINEFRQHSLELAMWSRALASTLKFRSESTDAVYERLLREPVDMYGTFSNFYDPEISERYLNLFTQQVITFRNLTEALMANNYQAADHYWRNWFGTAEEIAELLAQINPYWEREQWRQLLLEYQLMLYYEVLAIISGDYRREIEIFDRIVDQTTVMADYMSRGLIMNLTAAPPEGSQAVQRETGQFHRRKS